MSETQRVAIVTGAAGGIGRAMTRGLLAAGIRVAGVDRDVSR
jgi:NAD(P)-dependent dehydrogenase (short-subunit alcohol dehydrogenase family)